MNDPFFVYSWVLLTAEQENIITEELLAFLKEERLHSDYELSSVKLWQSSRGRRRWSEILHIVNKTGAIIFITYSEKVFELCVRIASTYLDPDHNPKVQGYLIDVEFRHHFHNVLYTTISRDLLGRFLQACNIDDVPNLKRIGYTLAKQLVLHPDERVSNAARVMISGLDDIYRFGQRIIGAPENIHLTSSQSTVFLPSLMYIDSALDTFNLKADLIRDQDIQFGKVLDFVYAFLRGSTMLRNIISCKEGLSSHSIGIQIADLSAGIATRVLTAKYKGQNLKPDGWDIWKSMRANLPYGTWGYQMTAENTRIKLAKLWDYSHGPKYLDSPNTKDADNPPQCSCGKTIESGNMRDFYIHVLKSHADSQLAGITCHICNETIPLWLGTCHDVIDHSIKPPFKGDFYFEMQKDYEVLQKIREQQIRVNVLKQH